MHSISRVEFLGIFFDQYENSAHFLKDLLKARKFATGFVVTPNVDHINRLHAARPHPEFVAAYRSASAIINDSKILETLARLVGIKIPAIPGSDITSEIFGWLDPGARVLLLSSSNSVLNVLSRQYPEIVFDQFAPPQNLINSPAAMDRCALFAAQGHYDFVFIGIGSPQQEIVALRIATVRKDPMMIFCVGASLDFLTGEARRAPIWVRKIGCEWLHRLAQNPRRLWKRYLFSGPYIFIIFAKWAAHTLRRPK